MEKFKSLINAKAFNYIALFVGIVSMLFIGQEKQIGIFAWIAPLFLLQFTRRARLLNFLLLFLLLAIAGYFTLKTHNMFNDPVFGIINGTVYALVNTLFYLIDRLLYKKGKGFISTLIFPSVYVVIEATVTLALGTSGILAHTQFLFAPLAQLSTLTGMFGITFIICWLASIVHWLTENEFQSTFVKKSLFIYGGIIALIILYGIVRSVNPKEQQTVNVATITGVLDLHELAHKEKEALIALGENPDMEIPTSLFSSTEDIDVQIANTKKAAEAGAKIIVWSEAALFISQEQFKTLFAEIKSIASNYGIYILMAFFEENSSSDIKPINNKSILISKDGSVGWEYMKSHPTPVELPIVNPGNSVVPYFDTEYGRLGCVICYDYDFPFLLRQASKNEVDIMLVPAYDWEEFAFMHSKMARFETLQSGWSLIRANGIGGIHTIMDAYGNVSSELISFESRECILYADLPMGSTITVYAMTGNVFVVLCIVFLVFSIFARILSFIKSKKA